MTWRWVVTTTWQGLLATFTEEMNGLLLATFVVDGAVGVHTKIKGEGDRPPPLSWCQKFS
ncbi:MAG: hypothetical protein AAGA75_03170 [Cyanobacteria bacterium P01_E01_bin.6]